MEWGQGQRQRGLGQWRRRLIGTFASWLAATVGVVVIAPDLLPVAKGTTVAATYVRQGPSPIRGGQVENIVNGEVAGAVHTVVAHPADPNTLWIGTVNGGIWRTHNATAASPTWVPLTDQMPSLSIGALELDPTVATNTVLVAGIARVSSFGRIAGPRLGLLRTTDGGTTWAQAGVADLTGEDISGIAPRGNTIVVSSSSNTRALGGPGQGGIFRSTNGGGVFTRLSGNGAVGLPSNRGVFDLVSDPSNNARLYAAAQAGVFRSDDTGATWTNVTNQITGITDAPGGTNNMELSVHNSAGQNVVYAGVVNAGQLAGLWRSTDQGANWTAMDIPLTNEGGTLVGLQPRQKPGSQGGVHFSIRADAADPDLVYLGGDRQPNPFPNDVGAGDFTGRLFRCDNAVAAGNADVDNDQCEPITNNGTANNSSPHADSREMVFDANGDLVEVDDGGVYRQTDPATGNGVWQTLNGNLQIAEHHSCDYDNVANIILCGNQDTGAPEQSAAGSTIWDTLSAGDGGYVAVNDFASPSVRFSSSNSFGAGGFRRRTCNAANACVNSAPGFIVNTAGNPTIQAFEACGPGCTGLPLYTPLAMNKLDGSRFIVTSNRVYESTDSLDNFNIVVNSLGLDGNGNPVNTTRAIAYGGRAGGADNPGVLWFGDGVGRLWLRSAAAGAPVQLAAWTFGAPSDIVLDPNNWAIAYVSAGNQVFRTTDAGASFTNVTGNLPTEAPNANVRSLEIVPVPGTNVLALLAGTDSGVFMTQTQNLGTWAELGSNLPNTIAFDLHHDATDDVLLVSTMGRGAWLVQDISAQIPVADLRVTKTDSPDPVKAGEELFYTVTVTDDGPDNAVGVVVTDDLPDEVIYLSDDGGCTYDSGQHRLTCPLGDIPASQARSFTIKTLVRSDAVVNEGDGTLLIHNVVSVASVSVDDDTSDNTFTTPTFVQEQADLKVTKECKPDDELPAGQTGTCTVFVDNLGPSSARDIVLRDTHVSDGAFTFGTITPSQGTCSPPSNNVVTCNLGDLAATSVSQTGRATVTIEVSATEDVDINDVAEATSPTPDPNTANNQAREHISVMAVSDLSLDKAGPATAVAGHPGNIQYDLTITNHGPSTATGVVIEDVVPAGVSVVSVVGSGGAGCNAGAPGDPTRPATCSYGTLAPSAVRTMTVVVHVLPDTLGIIHNDARVASPTFDDDLSDNLDTVATEVNALADLSVVKADSPDPVVAGGELTYTLTVFNAGPSTAKDVKISDEIPPGTSFVTGVDGNGATVCALVQPGLVVCDLAAMAPGTSKTVYLTVLVAPSVGSGSILTNTATVQSSTPDPVGGNNTDGENTDVVTSADLWLDKTGTLRSGNPAPVLVYGLRVHNDSGCESDAQSSPTPTCGEGGPSDAQSIVVTDTLPLTAKKLVVQYVSPQCSYNRPTHTVTCTSTTVPAGAVVEFVIEAQVSGSVGTITNTASLTSATPDPVAANNTDSVDVVHKGGTGKTRN